MTAVSSLYINRCELQALNIGFRCELFSATISHLPKLCWRNSNFIVARELYEFEGLSGSC